MQYLVVVRAFSSHRVGDVITDESSIRAVLASEHAENVVRITPPTGD